MKEPPKVLGKSLLYTIFYCLNMYLLLDHSNLIISGKNGPLME